MLMMRSQRPTPVTDFPLTTNFSASQQRPFFHIGQLSSVDDDRSLRSRGEAEFDGVLYVRFGILGTAFLE